jgi:choline dehydrogenase-like flavoprotein
MSATLASILQSSIDAIATAPLDCLVIGSGTAGVTTAVELATQGLRIAIVEAGPFVLTEHVGSGPFARRADVVPKIHDLVRYRTLWTSSDQEQAAHNGGVAPNNNAWSVVGGRTLFWGGCTPRFLDADFADWPYDAAGFRPWYDRAEALIGCSAAGSETTDAPPFVSNAKQDALLARLHDAGVLACPAPLTVDTRPVGDGRMSSGFDSSVARLLRCPLFGRAEDGATLSLVANAAAVDLQLTGNHVSAVTVLDRTTGRRVDIKAAHVVLAGGAVQSTRLALAAGLGKLDPLIGHFIGDHLFRQAVFKLPEPLGERALYLFIPPLPDRPFHAQVQGMLKATWYSPLHATVWLDGQADGQYMLYYCFGISKAEKNGRVVLTDAAAADDPLGSYFVVCDRTEDDLRTLAAMDQFTQTVADILGAELERTQENGAGAALHEFGGLRMANSPENGVTDPSGRFWKIPNLSCADSAIWPSQGSANSYLTITAVALRNAALLAESLRDRPAVAA